MTDDAVQADDVVEAATLAALRASCADVCSYAVNGAPGTGCHGECKRGDWGDDEIRNMRVAVKAALASAANLLRQSAPVALREPKEAMLVAAREWSRKKYGIPISSIEARECWQAMFDAAPASAPVEAVGMRDSIIDCLHPYIRDDIFDVKKSNAADAILALLPTDAAVKALVEDGR